MIDDVAMPEARQATVLMLEHHDGVREELARGIARYDSGELTRIRGCRSHQITERLGYAYGPVAVHRNDLILT